MKMKLSFAFMCGCIFMGIVFYIVDPDMFGGTSKKRIDDLNNFIFIPKEGVDSLSFDLNGGDYLIWINGETDTLRIKYKIPEDDTR